MGNSGSNNSASHQQQCPLGNQEMGRGWTHSFPRELTRHHSQPPGHKVLPEPPNQRLRATNNGSIIHNGGTISGRRPSALTLPHDLNKGVYRSRSTSASNLGPRSRSNDQNQHNCCPYRSGEVRCRDHEMTELKRFGSEPDLRYSPSEHSRNNNQNGNNNSGGNHQHHNHHRSQSGNQENRHSSYYPERESRERESRYRGKKKYKAPAPPGNGEGSSPDSYKWEIGQERENCCRTGGGGGGGGGGGEEEGIIQPPPRKSRLFKTRAETKKAQSNWQSCVQESEMTPMDGSGESRRWRGVGIEKSSSGKENRCGWREHSEEQENWSRDETKRRSNKYDGKNTLQRSLSSPEFQAELIQVARKVRNKLNYNRRVGPIGAATIISSHDSKNENHPGGPRNSSGDDFNHHGYNHHHHHHHHHHNNNHHRDDRKNSRSSRPSDDRRPEKKKIRNPEEPFDSRRDETRSSARYYEDGIRQPRGKSGDRSLKEIRGYENEIIENPGRTTRDKNEERSVENPRRRRVVEKSYVYEERITTNATNELVSGRKSINERHHEFLENSTDERHPTDRLRRPDHEPIHSRRDNNERNRRKIDTDNPDQPRTRSASPALRNCRERDRGQGSGRESTPEMPRGKEKKSDHRKRRNETKDDSFVVNEKRWSSNVKTSHETTDGKISEKNVTKETREARTKNWNGLPPSGKSTPKTYYFSVDDGLSRDIRMEKEIQQVDHAHPRLQARDSSDASNNAQNRTDDSKSQSGTEDIALKLRPTLPKKQLEIPRFSPSAAWRLLSALETPGPTMSTASEEVPVMYEERIERLARPPPLVALGPRSSHDKSGDSGISGDAGGGNDDSLDVSTTNRMKTGTTTRPTWTPQQDLGEESSSDAGVDSPPPMAPSIKFPTRPHVFSLSLPRDENRFYSEAKTTKENSSFNSLQKLKKSVTGALGLMPNEIEERRRPGEALGENWLLSSSAPNSLQHNKPSRRKSAENGSPGWGENKYVHDNNNDEEIEVEMDANTEDKPDFPIIMKPPSFSYLASGGHVMYLPDSNETEHRTQSLNYRNSNNDAEKSGNSTKHRKNVENTRTPNKIGSFGINGISINGAARDRDIGIYRERSFTDLATKSRKYPNFFKSCENISEMRQRSVSPVNNGPESLQDPKADTGNPKINIAKNQKAKRFTFQSTVRQIERRRLAEKLSREAEAKERQRKSELEVMRKVEEEFQRKRAREKANIRQQLRLYSMDENSSSLPPAWDSSQLSRADPDGAPSSSASSPTSAPPGKMANRKSSTGSDEYQHRKRVSESRAQQQQQQQQPPQQREYKDYRPKYYDWAPDSSSHLDVKQTTVHPKVVYDIPKSSHVFVDANVHTAKPANVISTPRSDNYRKDFAHGAVAAKSSLASSDSELSQPNTRPHSRQNGNKSNKPLRSRSASPARSEGAGSEESPVEAIKQERSASTNGFILNGVQPFVREKSYRPITFNPRPPPPPVPS